MAERTQYVVLRLIGDGEGGEVWQEVGAVESSSQEAAARAFAEDSATLEAGAHELRAVPTRSWPEVGIPVTVATKRTVTVGARREVASAAAQ